MSQTIERTSKSLVRPELVGNEPKLWAECIRANWQRLGEIREARAEQQTLWNLLRQKARSHQKQTPTP